MENLKKYKVSYIIDGESDIKELSFVCNIPTIEDIREKAKRWITDDIRQTFNNERKLFQIYDIREEK